MFHIHLKAGDNENNIYVMASIWVSSSLCLEDTGFKSGISSHVTANALNVVILNTQVNPRAFITKEQLVSFQVVAIP